MARLIHFVVGFELLLHVLLWGAGLAILIMPRTWRRFWAILAVPAGLVLQSAIVWIGVHLGWGGTDRYAWASVVVPLVLLAIALWRYRNVKTDRGAWRAAAIDVSRFGLIALMMAGLLMVLVLPLAIASGEPTTISLGSREPAEDVAQARVLQEFSRGDSFASAQAADVLRLKRFMPPTLVALNASLLSHAPAELASLVTMVVLAGSLPVVFWIARAVIGYSAGTSLVIALLYGISPITWHAVAHGATGRLLAAQGVALVTWAGVALWRGRLTWRRVARFSGVLGAGYWLVLGSSEVVTLVCLVPAVWFAAGLALWRRAGVARFGRWLAAVLAPLIVMMVIVSSRIAGLEETLAGAEGAGFIEEVPVLFPEAWMGLVSGPELEAWNFLGLRWAFALGVGGAFTWAMWRAVRQGRPAAWMVTSIVVPVLGLYAWFERRAGTIDSGMSGGGYPVIAVCHVLLLPAICWWVTLRRSRRLTEWFGVVGMMGLVIALNLVALALFVFYMARPPLMIDHVTLELRRVR